MASYAEKLSAEMKQSAAGFISRGANTSIVNMAKESKEKAIQAKKEMKAKAKNIQAQEKILKSDLDRVKGYEEQVRALAGDTSPSATQKKADLDAKLKQASLKAADSKSALLLANADLFGKRSESESFLQHLNALQEIEQSDYSPKKLREKKAKFIKQISKDADLSDEQRELLLSYANKATSPDPASVASVGLATYNFKNTEFKGAPQPDMAQQVKINKETKNYSDPFVAKTTTKEK